MKCFMDGRTKFNMQNMYTSSTVHTQQSHQPLQSLWTQVVLGSILEYPPPNRKFGKF